MRHYVRQRKEDAVPEGARRCKGCGAVKPLEAFREVRSLYRPPFRLGKCRVCERTYRREWRENGGRVKERAWQKARRRERPARRPRTTIQRLMSQRDGYVARRRKIDERIADLDAIGFTEGRRR